MPCEVTSAVAKVGRTGLCLQRLEQEVARLLDQLRIGTIDGEEMERERQKLLSRLSAAELVSPRSGHGGVLEDGAFLILGGIV